MNDIKDYRKKPVQVRAMKWEGEPKNQGDGGAFKGMNDLTYFTGINWTRADVHDVPWYHADEEKVIIYNHLEKCWIPCPVGHYIVQGVFGEFYPVDPKAFDKTYKEIK